jgi:LCP family protein required for cell wall assembly
MDRNMPVRLPTKLSVSDPRGAMRRHDDTGDSGWAQDSDRLARPPVGRRSPRKPAGARNHSSLILATLASVVALVLAGGSLAAYAKYRSVWDGINRVDVRADLGHKRPPLDPNAQNILVIGSDSRSGKNGRLGGRSDIGGSRSDTIMLLHVAPGAHQIAVLSIPRDSVVPILKCTAENGTTGQTAQPSSEIEQINATFAYGGPGCLWETIEQTTGIHINDFVELNFLGFVKVINALHGVTVCLPQAVHDPVSRLNLTAGKHHIDGLQALAFWRTREGIGLGDDPQRIQRDQFLMASLVQGVERSSLLKSPTTMLSVIDTLTAHHYLTTDSGLTPTTMLRLGEALRGIATEHVQFVTVPWNTYTGNAQWISSSQTPATGNSAWVQWLQPQANDLFSAIAHDTKLPKASKQKKVKTISPALVKVKVLNGTSKFGLGASTATSLSTRGFDVVGQASDAANSNYTSTVIEYTGAAELPAAQTLAQLFGNVTLRPKAHLAGPAIRLILGSSFTALKAATGGSGISNLAGTYGGITGNVNICSDSNAFSG